MSPCGRVCSRVPVTGSGTWEHAAPAARPPVSPRQPRGDARTCQTGGGAAAPPHGHTPCTAVCSFVLSSYPPVRTGPEARCDSAPSKWPPWSSTLPNSLLLGTVLRVGARTENGPRGGCGRRPRAGQPPRGTAAGHCPLPRGSGCRALTCSPLSVAFKLERNRSCCRGGKGMSPWQRRLRAR